MVKTTATRGAIFEPEYFNALQNLTFNKDEPEELFNGEYYRLKDDALSNAAGNIKPEWRTFRDTLKVSAGTGLSATYNGGAVVLPAGTLTTIAPGTIALSDNATNYVFVDNTGAVVNSTTFPVTALPLAQITTVAGAISGSVIDLRPRFRVQPTASAIKIFGGPGEQGDYTVTGTESFADGYYYFRNLVVQAGAVLNISRFARIFCSGTVTIAGAVNVTFLASGGASLTTSLSGGATGGLSGSGPGGGSGSSVGAGGASYNYAASSYGSGGASGIISQPSGSVALLSSGGRGGGGLWLEAAGAIAVTGTIGAVGEPGTNGQIISGTGGSSTGGGGGSGGLILLSSLTSVLVSPTATLDVRGGNGGNGAGLNAYGGAGGGGGQVVLISPSNNATGATILLSGGALGTPTAAPSIGGGNGGGFGGAGGGGGGGGTTAQTGLLILRNFRAVGS